MDHLLYSGRLYSFYIECNTGRMHYTSDLVSHNGFIHDLDKGISWCLSLV
jgi:hypothetical protein